MDEANDPSERLVQAADRLDAEIGLDRVAEVFARAVLGAAQCAGCLEAVMGELDEAVGRILAPDPRVAAVLASADVPDEEKAAVIGRLDCLRAIHRRVRAAYDQVRGLIRVRLTTARPISPAVAERLAERLREALGGEIALSRVVDPAVIGGAVLQVGDTVYDVSVLRQLQAMQQRVSDRIAHEVESRRDRLPDPERG
jgi:F-type H+-transporting ATPase subunit delta